MCKKGQLAACILYITNGASFLLGLAGLALGIWLLVADTGVTNSFPDYLAVAIIIIMIAIALVAGLGVFATVAQMKENMDDDPTTGAALGKEKCCSKDCCNSCGISLYCFLSIVGSLLGFCFGVVALHYSGELPNQITAAYNGTSIVGTVDSWFSSLNNWVDDKLTGLIETNTIGNGTDWINTQDLLGCCGWNSTDVDPDIYLTGECCGPNPANATIIDSLSADSISTLFAGDTSIVFGSCNYINNNQDPLTCKGVALYAVQSNLLVIGIVCLVIFVVLLVCFICALKVRYCSGGQGNGQGAAAVAPAGGINQDETPKVELAEGRDV